MKNIGLFMMLGYVVQASLYAQMNSQPATPSTNGPAAKVAATVIARSPSSRIWARITSQTNRAGQVSAATNRAYTELGSGLCYVKGSEMTNDIFV